MYYVVSSDQLVAIAQAIRSKMDYPSVLAFPDDFISAINDIQTVAVIVDPPPEITPTT